METTKKRIPIYIVIALAIILVAGGVIVMSLNREKPAAEALSEMMNDTPESINELLSLGQKFLLDLEYEQAIIAFTKVIEIEPKCVPAYLGRGDAYVQWKEELELAKADYEMAIELDETSVDGYLGLVDVYIRMGDYDKALEIARLGYDNTGGETLLAKIQELEEGNITDSSGNVRRMSTYEDGVLIWHHEYTYVQNRETSVTSFDTSNNVTSHVDILYDDTGRNVAGWYGWADSNGVLSKYENIYDIQNNVVRKIIYDHDGSLLYYFVREYNEAGKLIKETAFGPHENATSYTTMEYDSQGKMIKRNSFHPDGTPDRYVTFTYDSEGNRIDYSIFQADGTLLSKQTREYDFEGKLVKESQFGPDGVCEWYTLFDYDADGNEVSKTRYSGDGELLQETE